MTATDKTKKGHVYSYLRWSSDRQMFGDSERRQEELAIQWCRNRGLKMADKTFVDRGISAWKGANRRSGALGALLKVVQSGDMILIESNDRFSREDPITALVNLKEIVGRGVTVVFLQTQIEVTKANFNDPAVLFTNFFQSYSGNSENERKSLRVRQAMAQRRKLMESGNAVAGRLPAWLDWNARENRPVINQQKANVVKKLFELCIAGHGLSQIERLMKDVPPITARDSYRKQKARWNTFFIHRTLTDRSVLGYQRSSGLKVFPPIIDEKTYYCAAAKLKARKRLTTGIDHRNNNLFTGLVKCSHCGSTYYRQRARAKGFSYDYLVCSGALRHATSCRKLQAINYELLEKSFLSLMAQTDLIQRALFGQQQASRVDAIQAELDDVRAQCEKYMELITSDPAPSKRMVANLKLMEAKEDLLAKELDTESAKAAVQVAPVAAYEQLQASWAKEPENRAELREILRDLVDKIVVEQGGRKSQYSVYLKSAQMPITVLLRQTGWLINPVPRLALQANSMKESPLPAS